MAYNASHDTIILPKNKLVGQCKLILQPNEAAYQQSYPLCDRRDMQKTRRRKKTSKERSSQEIGC